MKVADAFQHCLHPLEDAVESPYTICPVTGTLSALQMNIVHHSVPPFSVQQRKLDVESCQWLPQRGHSSDIIELPVSRRGSGGWVGGVGKGHAPISCFSLCIQLPYYGGSRQWSCALHSGQCA